MKKKATSYVLTVVGLFMLAVGLCMVKTISNPQGIMRALPYVCVGLGCGIFGHGTGNIISRRVLKNSPDIQKEFRINRNDERNITIMNRAKSKAYDMMIIAFGALILAFGLMGVDMIEVLLLVFAYLFIQGYAVYYRCKYDKEM